MTHAVARRAIGVVAVAVAGLVACSNEGGQSCDELRAEYERLYPPASTTSWSDVQALQENVAEGLALRARIDEQCG